jgi:hypothetical protein
VQRQKKSAVVVVLVGIALLIVSGQYVHRGYIGVIQSGESLRLLDHGPHLKAPWQRVTIYPTRSRELRIEASVDGPSGRADFDVVVLLSVVRDSVPSLHMAYQGAYLEELVSPAAAKYISEYGDAFGIWDGDYDSRDVSEAMAEHLDRTLRSRGINVDRVWLR